MAKDNAIVGGPPGDGQDFFPTPPSMTGQLFEKEKFEGNVLEPACGEGHMVRVIQENYDCISSDKYLYPNFKDKIGIEVHNQFDFLAEDGFPLKGPFDNIITNPPFAFKDECRIRAKQIAVKQIAFLLKLDFLHGKDRFHNIWQDKEFPLKKVYIFVRRPFLQNEIRYRYSTGMATYAWFIWDRDHSGPWTGDHIDNSEYVKGTGKYPEEMTMTGCI